LLRAAPLKKFCLENKESPASLQCSQKHAAFPQENSLVFAENSDDPALNLYVACATMMAHIGIRGRSRTLPEPSHRNASASLIPATSAPQCLLRSPPGLLAHHKIPVMMWSRSWSCPSLQHEGIPPRAKSPSEIVSRSSTLPTGGPRNAAHQRKLLNAALDHCSFTGFGSCTIDGPALVVAARIKPFFSSVLMFVHGGQRSQLQSLPDLLETRRITVFVSKATR